MSAADHVSAQAAEALAAGSKSFAAAARLLDPATRESARLLYAWCRHLDDLTDGQTLGHGRIGLIQPGLIQPGLIQSGLLQPMEQRIDWMRRMTLAALAGAPQIDPVFEGLRRVALRHGIPSEEPLTLIDGFAMDLGGRVYHDFDDTLDYCYHVAGVVGLMMGRVLGVEDEDTLDRACDLGIAFQLTNIARDLVDDWSVGRVYLPRLWLAEAGLNAASVGLTSRRPALFALAGRLLDAAEPYYASARAGVARLPPRSAWAILTACKVYRDIGQRIRAAGPAAWDRRAVVPARRKAGLALAAGFGALALRLGGDAGPRPAGLWTRRRPVSAPLCGRVGL